MKLGILGGSFNPIHLGHLFLADTALSSLGLDRVVFIPAYRSPFKLGAQGMEDSTDDRIDMLAAAVAGDSRMAIDDCEVKREGVSYTVDTIEDIIARYTPEGKPSLIIGDDIAGEFPRWKNSERILELANLVIARRVNSKAVEYPYPHKLIENEVMNISSNLVRTRIKEDSDWRSLVPAGVRAIIEERRLYGFSGRFSGNSSQSEDCSQTIILRVEAAARESLSTVRFLHSRNTALLAGDLCRRFGLDPAAGYLAGIAHDLAKQIENKQMMKLAKSDGMEISELEKEKPNLLHGRAAAVLLKERFCIHNEDILEAVAVHTSGSEDMGLLAKVIYIADKTEVSRNIEPALRKMLIEDDADLMCLDSILLAVLKKTIVKLEAKKQNLSEQTVRLLEVTLQKLNKKEKNR